ncbi:related to retrotransposon HobS hobase [Claviceps purpurea 20.1]|uniref:Related to retrotransposon HobS hobase n=1 Tax=Claviceps purpurea (strain 20.1) TaxID=1111077 RepID=M1W4A1_CLAP2|nr:related to retrotransposon HobS hobase [Claviceps purpurea 20.1]
MSRDAYRVSSGYVTLSVGLLETIICLYFFRVAQTVSIPISGSNSKLCNLVMDLDISIDEKIRRLVRAEEAQNDRSADAAHAARSGKARDYTRPSRRNGNASGSHGGNVDHLLVCYFCKEDHWLRNCPYLVKARRWLAKYKTVKSARNTPSTNHSESSSSGRKSKSHGYNADDTQDPGRDSDGSISVGSVSDDDVEDCLLSKDVICRAPPSIWASDTGATSHMSDQPSLFRSMIKIKPRRIRVGGGELQACEKGTVEMVCSDGSSMLLSDVLYVPKLGINLMSGRKMCQAGLRGTFNSQYMYFNHGDKKIITAKMVDGLYVVSHVAKGFEDKAFPSVIDQPVETDQNTKADGESIRKRYFLYHRRFAHLGPEKISSLHRVTTLEKAIKIPVDKDICEVCSLTKLTNRIPRTLSEHKDELLALVQFDIAGPFPKSLRGNQYFLQIVDNYSRKSWAICLALKGDATDALHTWKKLVETQTACKVKAARSDNAPELLKAIELWRKTSGVRLESTTIASSHQNGLAERSIRTAENDMRAMLKDANLPLEFWDEAVEADAYLRNRTQVGPTIKDRQVSPEEAFTGEVPSIDHIRVWGSKCYTYVNLETIPAHQRHDKLVDTGRVGVFLGYSENTNRHYRVYSPELGYTSRSSRVLINEDEKGGAINLRLRNCAAGPQGTPNVLDDRRPRVRPRKELNPVPEAKEGLTQPQTDPRNTDDKLVTDIASNIPDGHDQPAEPIMSVGDTDSTSAIPEGHDQPAAPIMNVGNTMDTDSTSATPEGYDHPTKELANTDEKLVTDSASKVLEGQSRPAESPASAVDQEKEDHPHTDLHVDESRHHYLTRSKRKRSNSAAE